MRKTVDTLNHHQYGGRGVKDAGHDLFVAILLRAAEDALTCHDWFIAREAMGWFRRKGEDFKFICEHASRDADYVHAKMMPYINKRAQYMKSVRGWKGTMDNHIIYSLKKGIFKDETKNYL
jgi:hypothetical protein